MDTPEMVAGASCYLRVNVEGALFSLGDGHYRQGEGESCGTAVEGAMNVTVIVDLVKGGGPAWPRIETDTHLMCIGSGRPLEEAWRASQVEMIGWLGELYGLDRLDAYQLLTQISQVPDRQRGRPQLQRGHQDRQAAASARAGVRRDS